MKVYVVYFYEHYDDYKRADSYADIVNIFTIEHEAYKCAVEKFVEMFISYENTDFEDFDTIANNQNILYHTLSYKEKYDIIKDKLYTKILPEAEYTAQPTHHNYFVKEFNV